MNKIYKDSINLVMINIYVQMCSYLKFYPNLKK